MPIADSTARAQKRATAVRIPKGLAEMSNMEAALAYAKAGVHVLPARGKKPGGYVGAGWQDKSSRDPEQIRAWWEQWPEANIAAHLGPSGLIAFDRDKVANLSALPEPYRSQLGRARFQETRPDGSRGHYLFRVRKSDRFSNSPGGFSAFGDVRGANGVIILEPSTHADGGRYHWPESGSIPTLPDDLRALLTAALEHEPALPNADLEAFLDTYTKADRPAALKGPLTWFRKEIADGGGRHQSLLEAASWAFREVFAGCYPARTAYDALAEAWEAAFLPPDAYRADAEPSDRCPGQDELTGIAAWAAAQALTSDPRVTLARLERDKSSGDEGARFVAVNARTLAELVPPMRWLVRDVWPENSFGPMGGEKKTLKTYNLLALGLAVASGEPMLGRFEVATPGPVLIYVGEGGRIPFQRRLQRVAAAYKFDLDALAELPFYAVFETGALDGSEFRSALKRNLDEIQPALVAIDPLYAFHPPGVEATNLYERGRMLADLSSLVAEKAALIVPDHFKKSGAKSLDLDSIAQAGMAQWADSWVLQTHREPPDLATGTFRLAVEFGSRQWGGDRWAVDWSIPAPGETPEDAAPITWSVEHLADEEAPSGRGAGRAGGTTTAARRVLEVLDDRPFELTKTGVVEAVGGNAGTVRDAIDELFGSHLIEAREVSLPDKSGRAFTRPRLGRAAEPGRLRPRREAAP